MTPAVSTVTTRHLMTGLTASGALLAGVLAPLAPAHAHAAATHHNVRDDGSGDFYYDPGSPCDASICDSTAYSPNTDYYYDPGSSCDASICDAGLYNPSGDFYYDPGSSTDSNLIDTSSVDNSSGDTGSSVSAARHSPVTADALGRLVSVRLVIQPNRTARPVATRMLLVASAPTLVAPPVRAGQGAAVGSGGVRIFVDRSRSYKVTYPATWQHGAQQGADLAVGAPNQNAAVVSLAITVPGNGHFTIKDVLPSFFRSLGGMPDATMYRTSSVHGDMIEVSRVRFHWTNGSGMGGAVLVLTRNHNREYLIAGVVADLSSDTARAAALQVSAVVSSLDVLHTITAVPRHVVGFKDATHTYALAYPQGWTRLTTTSGLNLALRSPDAGAVVGGVSVPAPAGLRQVTPAVLRQVLGGFGQSLGTIQDPPVFHNVAYRRVIAQATVFSFRRGNGSTGRAILVVALHRAHLCAVVGIVANGHAPQANHEAAQLSWVVSSLRFR